MEKPILKHAYKGNVGTFVKCYTPTGGRHTTQIILSDGQIYYAPTCEFSIVKNKNAQ